jgi:leucyl-tRNA synthetase
MVLRLYTQVEFYQEMIRFRDTLRRESDGYVWADHVMFAEINRAIRSTYTAYELTNYRDALKNAFFELQNARDRYRDVTSIHGTIGMSWPVIERFMRVQALLILPLAPHFAEYVWREALQETQSIRYMRFPEAGPVDESLLAASIYLQKLSHTLHTAFSTEQNPKKGKTTAAEQVPIRGVEIFVATGYPLWQERAVAVLVEHYNTETSSFAGDDVIAKALKTLMKEKPNKKLVPFAMELKQRAVVEGLSALQRRLLFDEMEVVNANRDYLSRALGGIEVIITPVDPANVEADAKKEAALPGEPSQRFFR